jgi:hypothetical protein
MQHLLPSRYALSLLVFSRSDARKTGVQVIDKLMKKVEKAPHAKKTSRAFGKIKCESTIRVDSSHTEAVPEHVARALFAGLHDRGSKNIFKATLAGEELGAGLGGRTIIQDGNVSANGKVKAAKDGSLGPVEVTDMTIK